ncbi:hypothetical protein [Streptomyces boninensis]|uniref:hypothetical protein n=1 Tax=Streptomyces boninensis TaxID=2039455 RepID=UPI003B21E05B
MAIHVLFEGTPGVIVRSDDLVIEGAALDDVVSAAVRAAKSADRIELCGGMPVDVAARVRAAVSADVDVRVNRYGFESLEQVAAYKTAFANGEPGNAAFFLPAAESTPLTQHDGVLVAGVADENDLRAQVREAHARGAGIVELYAGLGISAAAVAREASGHQIPVGFID